MFRTTYLKKFLFSGSVYAASVITSEGDRSNISDQIESGDGGSNCDPCTGKLLRRSELPLYSDTHPPDTKVCEDKPSRLEKNISAARKEVWVWHDKYSGYREKVVEIAETGKAHTSVLIEQLRKDELPIPRSGAIVISGLAGVVLGLRGGWFKRIIYGSTAAGLMAAVCYPQETQEALGTTKKYIKIGYNFIYGEEPADTSVSIVNPCDVTFPGLPGHPDLPEFSDIRNHSELPPQHPAESQPPSTQENDCICTCRIESGLHSCSVHGLMKVVNVPHSSSYQTHFDHFAEESADVVYWGFRLG